jgi:hypothetical protein
MTGYLQRLVETTPGILPAAPQPVVRSQSPIAQSDQRLALDPLADAIGDVAGDVAPAASADRPIAEAAPPAGRATPPATAPQMPAPVAVQRFQAPSVMAAAPPPAAGLAAAMQSAAHGPAIVPRPVGPEVQAPAPQQAPTPRQEPAPRVSPVTIINPRVDSAHASPLEVRAGRTPPAPVANSARPPAPAKPAPSLDPTRPASPEPTPERRPDELAYVSPAERVLEMLQQLPRPAPLLDIDEATAAAPDRPPAAPAALQAQNTPGREIRETIREIVREVVSTSPAPPRDALRMPKTAAEASVIGPLGNPNAAARRLALMLR